MAILGAGGKARVELWSLDCGVRVRVNTISGPAWDIHLQTPGAPGRDIRDTHSLFQRDRIGRVGAGMGIRGVTGSGQKGSCSNADRVRQIGRYLGQGGIVRLRIE